MSLKNKFTAAARWLAETNLREPGRIGLTTGFLTAAGAIWLPAFSQSAAQVAPFRYADEPALAAAALIIALCTLTDIAIGHARQKRSGHHPG